MKILTIIDPISKLDQKWDNTLFLLDELICRGHHCSISEPQHIGYFRKKAHAYCRNLQKKYRSPALKKTAFIIAPPKNRPLTDFDLILIRKEPPFDSSYLHMTQLLELADPGIAISNSPHSIRTFNEKLVSLRFPKWIPDTFISSNAGEILEYQNRLDSNIIVKPINQRGGRGICLLKPGLQINKSKLRKITDRNTRAVIVQKQLGRKSKHYDKRVIILNGKVLAVYEKHPKKRSFVTNFHSGGTIHPAQMTRSESEIISQLIPFLKKEGVHLAGVDVMQNKLLEINITCPAGLREASTAYPSLNLFKPWADFLESQIK